MSGGRRLSVKYHKPKDSLSGPSSAWKFQTGLNVLGSCQQLLPAQDQGPMGAVAGRDHKGCKGGSGMGTRQRVVV